jgi:hypothetical protein
MRATVVTRPPAFLQLGQGFGCSWCPHLLLTGIGPLGKKSVCYPSARRGQTLCGKGVTQLLLFVCMCILEYWSIRVTAGKRVRVLRYIRLVLLVIALLLRCDSEWLRGRLADHTVAALLYEVGWPAMLFNQPDRVPSTILPCQDQLPMSTLPTWNITTVMYCERQGNSGSLHCS